MKFPHKLLEDGEGLDDEYGIQAAESVGFHPFIITEAQQLIGTIEKVYWKIINTAFNLTDFSFKITLVTHQANVRKRDLAFLGQHLYIIGGQSQTTLKGYLTHYLLKLQQDYRVEGEDVKEEDETIEDDEEIGTKGGEDGESEGVETEGESEEVKTEGGAVGDAKMEIETPIDDESVP